MAIRLTRLPNACMSGWTFCHIPITAVRNFSLRFHRITKAPATAAIIAIMTVNCPPSRPTTVFRRPPCLTAVPNTVPIPLMAPAACPAVRRAINAPTAVPMAPARVSSMSLFSPIHWAAVLIVGMTLLCTYPPSFSTAVCTLGITVADRKFRPSSMYGSSCSPMVHRIPSACRFTPCMALSRSLYRTELICSSAPWVS